MTGVGRVVVGMKWFVYPENIRVGAHLASRLPARPRPHPNLGRQHVRRQWRPVTNPVAIAKAAVFPLVLHNKGLFTVALIIIRCA